MDRSHIPMQTNPGLGFVQSTGAQYRPDTEQNLSTPGQSLPPPPPLIRHGQTSSVQTLSDNLKGALEAHFRRSLNPFSSASTGGGNGTSVPASMGSSMGPGNITSQSNLRPGFSGGPQPGAQQFDTNWVGSGNNTFISIPGIMPRVQSDPYVRQPKQVQLEFNIPAMQQDKQMRYANSPNNMDGIIEGGYTYGGFPDRLSTPGMMPSKGPKHGQCNLRQTAPNYPPDFRQPLSGYGSNAKFPVNQTLRDFSTAHQNVPRVPHPVQQHPQGNFLSPSQGLISVNPRPAHVSSLYGLGQQTQRPFGSQLIQGHITPGLGPIGSQSMQEHIPVSQGQRPYGSQSVQGNISPGQSLFSSQSMQGHISHGQRPFGPQSVQGHISPGQSPFVSPSVQGHISPGQSPFVSPSVQGHISPGQSQVRMSSGPAFLSNGQGHYGPSSRNQNSFGSKEGHGNFQGPGQPQPGSMNGQGFLTGWQQHEQRFSPDGFLNIADAASSLSQLSDQRQKRQATSESGKRLSQLKERLEVLQKQGMLGPGVTADAVLVKFAMKVRDRQHGIQPQHSQSNVVQTNSSSPSISSLGRLSQNPPISSQGRVSQNPLSISSLGRVSQNHASAIQSAFVISAAHEAHDKAVLGRWYAPPSSETKMPSHTPTPVSNPLPLNVHNMGLSASTETTPTTTSVSGSFCSTPSNGEGEVFMLKPTICSEQIIEYKVADLLRCMAPKARSRHTSSVDSTKSTAPSASDWTKNTEKSVPMSDKSEQNLGFSPAVNDSEKSVETTEEPGKTSSRKMSSDADEQYMETDSLLDFSKNRELDRLVLNSQFGTQDMNPEIDFRNYLPSPGFPADFEMTPSPVMDMENPSTSKANCLTSSESPQADYGNSNEGLCVPEVSTLQDRGNSQSSNEEDLPEPIVVIERDETPDQTSKKRKHSAFSDSKLVKLTPKVKRQRGCGRGFGRGRRQRGGARSRGRGRGRVWPVSQTLNKKQSKIFRGKRKQIARCSRGRGGKPNLKSGSEIDASPGNNIDKKSESAANVAGLDGQVIQKPRDLKKLMDNLPHEELEKTTVSLSTLKMMLAWQEAETNAGPDDVDQESDTASVVSVVDAPKITDAENIDTEDVTSEKYNKEHNTYEPPEENLGSNESEKSENELKCEKEVKNIDETQKLDLETSFNETSEENDNAAEVEMGTQNEKEIEISSEENKSGNSDKINDDSKSKEIHEISNTADADTDTQEIHSASKTDIRQEKIENKASVIDSRLATQVYSVTDTHKMTWVRYHGRTVTQLITPDGNYFIMKEIVRRCFRIQEPNKSLKCNKIGILKSKVLKIPDVDLEPLFYDYVVKNLVDRKVIRTIPDKFIIISEQDANRLFHYVCKDKYCGSSCVTPFFVKQACLALKSEETVTSEVLVTSDVLVTGADINSNNPNLPQMKNVSKKDRNLFDFLENEASPKVEKSLKKSTEGKKRQKHPSDEVIDLCFPEDGSNGYDSDKTLPYMDGKPISFDELKKLEEHAKNSSSGNENCEKENNDDIEMISSDTNMVTEKEIGYVTREIQKDQDKSKSDRDEKQNFKSKDSGSGNDVSQGYSEEEITISKTDFGKSGTLEKNKSENAKQGKNKEDESPIERLYKCVQSVCEQKLGCHGMIISNNKNMNEKSQAPEGDVIVIDDDEEENFFSETIEDGTHNVGVFQVTLDQMKKESSALGHENLKDSEKKSAVLVQVNNIDSTAVGVSGDKSENKKTEVVVSKSMKNKFDSFDTNTSKQKSEVCETGKMLDYKREVASTDISVIDLSAISESCLNDVDSVLASESTNEDVTIGEWIFPAPPKNYPEDGTKKLDEAGETLEKIIERANDAKKTEDYVDILDSVFRLQEPLKQWTNTLLDHYEEGLIIEAQRLKSLDQLKLKDISNTMDLEDDVEMEQGRGIDSG